MENPIITPSKEKISDIKFLAEKNLYLKAYQAFKSCPPISQWTHVENRLLGARVIRQLRNGRHADSLILNAYRNDPLDLRTRNTAARVIWRLQGPWKAWKVAFQDVGEINVPTSLTVVHHLVRSELAVAFKDFELASRELEQARKLKEPTARFLIEEALWYEAQDMREQALEIFERACDLDPFCANAFQNRAKLLLSVRKIEEAHALLSDFAGRTENSYVVNQLMRLEVDLEHFEEAKNLFERYCELAIIPDKDEKKRIHEISAEIEYHLGNRTEAIEAAERSSNQYFKILARNLKSAKPNAKKQILPVPFVHQDDVTCVPATLTAIADYWKHPIDHDQLAKDVTYDGTPDSAERTWLEERGWRVKEFALNWDTAVALIERGVPFALTTRDLHTAHMQGIMGYDEAQGIYYIREPGRPFKVKALAAQLKSRYESNGLRAIIMLPPGQGTLVDDIALPDTELYDFLFYFNGALLKHDREKALAYIESMELLDAENILTLYAKLLLARYDGNVLSRLDAIEAILKRFPTDSYYLYQKAQCFSQLGHVKQLITFLEDLLKKKEELPYHFPLLLAEQIHTDHREARKTDRLMRRVFSKTYYNSRLYWTYANILDSYNKFKDATLAHRLASTLSPYDEYYARRYFSLSRVCDQGDASLSYLKQRYEKYGHMSGQPAISLAYAYSDIGQVKEGLALLENALEKCTTDSELKLYSARYFYNQGIKDKAFALLELARTSSKEITWFREKARLEGAEGRHEKANKAWSAILEIDPLSMEATEEVSNLIKRTKGKDSALAFLKERCDAYPHFFSLRQEYLSSLRVEHPEQEYGALTEAIEQFGENAWLAREWVLCATELRDFNSAHKYLELAKRIESHNPYNLILEGHLLLAQERFSEAYNAYENALKIDIDYREGIHGLQSCCQSATELSHAIEFIRRQILEQVNFGSGISAFSQLAHRVLSLTEREAFFIELVEGRPDLFQTWDTVITHFLDTNNPEKALEYALQAHDCHPYNGEILYQMSQCYEKLNRLKKSLEYLELAVERNPGYSFAIRELADQYKRWQRLDEAVELVEDLIRKDPYDWVNFGFLSGLLWVQGKHEESLKSLEKTLFLNPGYEWAVNRYLSLKDYLGQSQSAIEFGKSLHQQKPDCKFCYEFLATVYFQCKSHEEAVETIDKALAKFPYHFPLLNLKSKALAELKRYDDALAVTKTEGLRFDDRLTMQIRSALIEDQRGSRNEAIAYLESCSKDYSNDFRAWKLLAEWYLEKNDFEAAHRCARELIRINPINEYSYCLVVRPLNAQKKREEARAVAMQGLQIQIDSEDNIDGLLESCETHEDYVNAFQFIKEQIISQVNYGDGIMEFAARAPRILSDEERLEVLHEIYKYRPDLWQSAAALTLEMNQQQQYEKAESVILEATKRFPQSARIFQIASEVYMHLGDKAAEIDYLKKALEISPDYHFATRRLADKYANVGNHEEAIRLLEQLAEKEPGYYINHGCLADIYLRTERIDQGVASLKKALSIEPDYSWAVKELCYSLSQTERFEEAITFFTEQSAEKEEDPFRFYNLSYCYSYKLQWAEAYQAIQRAIALKADYINAIDYRAYLLCGLGRFDEAAESCVVEGLNFSQSAQLKMRQGIVEMDRKDFGKAFNYFNEYLETDSNNSAAWYNLVKCCNNLDNAKEYLKAAEGLVRVSPHDFVSYGYLGDAYFKLNRRDDAKSAFKKSFLIDASYYFGVSRYFNYCLNEDDEEACWEVIAATGKLADTGNSLLFKLRLHVKRNEIEDAFSIFTELAKNQKYERITDGLEVLETIIARKKILKRVYTLLKEGVYHEELGKYWSKGIIDVRLPILCIPLLNALPYNEHSTLGAHVKFLSLACEKKAKWVVQLLVRKHVAFYKQHKDSYGVVTYAYSKLLLHRKVLSWSEDFKQYGNLEMWSILNVMYSAASLGKIDVILNLLEQTYALYPDHTYERFLTFVCLFEKSPQRLENYRFQLKKIDKSELGGLHQFYLKMIEYRFKAFGFEQDETINPKARIKRTRKELCHHFWRSLLSEPADTLSATKRKTFFYLMNELKILEQKA